MNRSETTEQTQGTQQSERKQGHRRERAGHERGEGGSLEMDRLREVGQNLGTQIQEQVQKRPYVVIGAAAGVGFVAGSLFGSRLGQVLLALGVGYVAKNLLNGDIGVERIGEQIGKLANERAKG